MEEFQEVIVLLQLGKEYTNTTDDIVFDIPGLTNDLKRLELKELKIGINAADVGANVNWITLGIVAPGKGLIPSAGQQLVTVPALEGGGTLLYRQYHHDNLVLLKLNSGIATQTSKPIKMRILKADGTPLAKDFVYLRMGLFEAKSFGPYLEPLSVSRFQAH